MFINKKIGQRRRLVKNLLNLEAIQMTMDELDLSVNPTGCYSSEYIENFCNSTLSSSVENDEMYKKVGTNFINNNFTVKYCNIFA